MKHNLYYKFKYFRLKTKGFTLMELLVVIAIIGLLSTLAVVALDNARKKAKDAKRLSDMRTIVTALEMYYDKYGYYPGNTDNDNSGWDVGYIGGEGGSDTFIQPLVDSGMLLKTPGDPSTINTNGYAYYKYSPTTCGYPASKGNFYVLGVRDMETSGRPHPSSPGWDCGTGSNTWNSAFDWVTGEFEE
jgi:prepilin-type N-terminal cleavage/methylation domain-containing protein